MRGVSHRKPSTSPVYNMKRRFRENIRGRMVMNFPQRGSRASEARYY